MELKHLLLKAASMAVIFLVSFSAPAQVSFNVDTDNGCPPLTVNATNTTTLWDTTNATFYWRLNSTDPFPDDSTHDFTAFYPAAGGYNLRLEGYDSLGNWMGNADRWISVSGSTGSFFPGDSSTFCPGETISFYTYDQYNNLQWTWGDGTPDAYWNWTQHTYADTGTYTVRLINNHNCGTDTVFQTIFVSSSATPAPDIQSNAGLACAGDQVDFWSNGVFLLYNWQFGDGDSSVMPSPSHGYADTGNYQVVLTVSNVCGQSNTDTLSIRIDTGLGANAWFNWSPVNCPNTAVWLNAQNPGAYSWDFDNGMTDTIMSPNTYFSDTGSYNVQLILTNGCGNSDTNIQVISIAYDTSPNPGAAQMSFVGNDMWYVDTDTVCVGDPVRFRNNSWNGTQLSYKWLFGDGDSSLQEEPPAHSFAAPGTYEVNLIRFTGCGGSDTASKWVVVQASASPRWNPFWMPMSACPGDIVFFFDWDVDGETGYTYSYNIWYGDGDSSGILTAPADPDMQFVLDTHLYADTGSFQVIMTATNGCGITDTVKDTVFVGNPNPMPMYLYQNSSNNGGYGGPSGTCPGDTVEFMVISSSVIAWDYGDGSPVDTSDPGEHRHIYATSGTYYVTGFVQNGCGSVDTILDTAFINMGGLPGGGADVKDNFGCIGDTMWFTRSNWGSGESGPQNELYTWSFGDGDSAFTVNANHVYTSGGIYNVSYTVTNSCGSSNDNVTVIIDEPGIDVSSLTINDAGCGASDGEVKNLTVVSPGQFTYSWANASMTEVGTASDLLTVPAGVYTLTVTNQNGCTASSGPYSVLETGAPVAPSAPAPPDYCDFDVIADLTATGTLGTLTWYSDAALTGIITTGSPFASGATTDSTFYVTETVGGCESPGTAVSINFNPVYFTPLVFTICSGDSMFLGGAPRYTSGVYYDTLPSVDGCDSVLQSTLTVDPAATADAGAPATICANGSHTLSGSMGGSASSINWTTTGDGSFDNPSLLAATYTPGVGDVGAGNVSLIITSDDPAGPCSTVGDTMVLTLDPAASSGAGTNDAICEGSTYTTSGSIGGSASNSGWITSGSGSFDDSTLLAAVYTPSASDIIAGSVDLTLITDDPAGVCPSASSFFTLTIDPAASAAAGTDDTICVTSDYTLSGAIGGSASTLTWTSSGDGSFSDPNSATAVYTLGAGDIAQPSLDLVITTDNPAGTCPAAADSMVLFITQLAFANAATDPADTVCGGSQYTLTAASIGGTATSVAWTTGGDGTFDDTSLVMATYTYGPTDLATGKVTLTMTTNDPAGPCPAATDTIAIRINAPATVNAGVDAVICEGATHILNGTSNRGTNTWTTSGSGSFDNPAIYTAEYTPSAADVASGSVVLALTTDDPDGAGPCMAASDSVTLTFIYLDSTVSTAVICTGDSVFLGGAFQTGAGTYFDTYSGSDGCDSIVATDLTVTTVLTTTLNPVICNGDSVYAGGAYQTVAGIYTDSLTASGGCDSVVTTNLSVNPTYITADSMSICDNDSIFIGGAFQTTAGAYVDAYTTADGCDSTVNTTLTVFAAYSVIDSVAVCAGDSVLLGGSYQYTAGIYIDSLTSVNGCDSIISTNLTVNATPVVSILGNTAACDSTLLDEGIGAPGDSYLWSTGDTTQTVTVNTTGTYWLLVTDGNGCQGTDTIGVTIYTSVTSTAADTICAGDSVLLGGAYQSTSGSYVDMYSTVDGCDSAVTTVLAVNPVASTSLNITICSGDSVLLGGSFQSAPGIYADTFNGSNGCDSILFTSLLVEMPYDDTVSTSICTGDSIFLSGDYQTIAGAYVDSFSSVNGCDSVIVTTLSVVTTITVSEFAMICAGDSLFAGGAYHLNAGSYVDSLTASGGCDSVVTTTLAVDSGWNVADTVTICYGDSVLLGGSYQTASGVYSDTLVSGTGCDSVVATTLNVSPQLTSSATASICDGDSILLGGAFQSVAGSYIDVYPGSTGCDSTVTTALSIDAVPNISVSPSPGVVCAFGDTVTLTALGASTYSWSPSTGLDTTLGAVVNASPGSATTYTVTGTSPAGCSGTTTVDIQQSTGLPAPGFTSDTTICAGGSVAFTNTSSDAIGYSWSFPGGSAPDSTLQNPVVTYPAAGIYDVSLTVYGCSGDSALVQTAYMTVTPGASSAVSATICSNDSIFIGGAYQSTAGTYTDTLITSGGCDSVVVTTLSVTVAPNAGISGSDSVCNSDFTYALASGLGGTPDGGGSWNDDDGSGAFILFGSIIPQLVTPGTYHFTYTVTGTAPCTDASATLTLTIVPAADAGNSGTLTACELQTSLDITTGLGGTPDAGGTWTDVSGTGALTGAIFNPSAAGIGAYDFTYTVAGTAPCTDATATVTVNVVGTPNAGMDGSLSGCESDFTIDVSAGLGGMPDPGGTWNDDDGTGSLLFGSNMSPAISGPGTFHFTYIASASGCADDSATVTLTIAVTPDAGSDGTLDVCDTSGVLDVSTGLGGTPDAGGTWSDDDATGALTGSSLNLSGLAAGSYNFTYTVTAATCADATAVVTVNVSTCIGIREPDGQTVSLYPNPSEGRFMLEFNRVKEDVRIEVYNGLGELIGTYDAVHQALVEIDLTGHPNGLYHVKIISGGGEAHADVSILR